MINSSYIRFFLAIDSSSCSTEPYEFLSSLSLFTTFFSLSRSHKMTHFSFYSLFNPWTLSMFFPSCPHLHHNITTLSLQSLSLIIILIIKIILKILNIILILTTPSYTTQNIISNMFIIKSHILHKYVTNAHHNFN